MEPGKKQYPLPGLGEHDPNFFKHVRELTQPSFRQKQLISQYRDRAFTNYNSAVFNPLFHKISKLSRIAEHQTTLFEEVSFDKDETSTRDCSASNRVSSDWKKLGFSREDPAWDMQLFLYGPQYQEHIITRNAPDMPMHRRATEKLDPSIESKANNQHLHKPKFSTLEDMGADVDATIISKFDIFFIGDSIQLATKSNPFRGRWRGGLLALDNMIYFLESKNALAVEIIYRRVRMDDSDMRSPRYPWATTAMEITRFLALSFDIIVTSNFIVRDSLVGSRWGTGKPDNTTVQQKDDLPEQSSLYTWRPYWRMLSEKQGLSRLFCCGMVLFDEIFETHQCTCIDYQNVLASTCILFLELMNKYECIKDIETFVYNVRTPR